MSVGSNCPTKKIQNKRWPVVPYVLKNPLTNFMYLFRASRFYYSFTAIHFPKTPTLLRACHRNDMYVLFKIWITPRCCSVHLSKNRDFFLERFIELYWYWRFLYWFDGFPIFPHKKGFRMVSFYSWFRQTWLLEVFFSLLLKTLHLVTMKNARK